MDRLYTASLDQLVPWFTTRQGRRLYCRLNLPMTTQTRRSETEIQISRPRE